MCRLERLLLEGLRPDFIRFTPIRCSLDVRRWRALRVARQVVGHTSGDVLGPARTHPLCFRDWRRQARKEATSRLVVWSDATRVGLL